MMSQGLSGVTELADPLGEARLGWRRGREPQGLGRGIPN
jgi:hypothetical protein